MHSILDGGSFCTNCCFNVAWHGGDQPVALLRRYWSPGCFDTSLQLICSVWSDVTYSIFLLTISHMGFRSGELAGQSSTVISWSANHLEVVLTVWADAKILLEKEISISIKLASRWKHKVFQNLLADGCIDFGLDKTQRTNTNRRHDTPNHHWLWKLHTGLQAVFLQTLSLHFQIKCKIDLYLNREHWNTEQQSSYFSP